MKKGRKLLLITSILIMVAIWGFIFIQKENLLLNGLDIFIFILIIVVGAIAMFRAIKKNREEKEGQPPDDELSNLIKYKSGYYAFLSSMYVWLFIFLFKSHFPDIETLLGMGILVSAALSFIIKYYMKKNMHG